MRFRSLAVAAALPAALLAGCGDGGGSVEGPVSVYVSLPLTGPRAADGKDAADGARLALERADGRAGGLEVEATYLDDAAGGGRWNPVAVGQNARAAVQDSGTAAYIGELDSQPTRASLPITNEAEILQVSPGASGLDLTEPAEGYPDSPDRYRPSGDLTLVRLLPDDAAQVRALAGWAAELKMRKVVVRIDQDEEGPFADLVAERFTRDAAEVGIEVVPEGSGADGVFLAGREQVPGAPGVLQALGRPRVLTVGGAVAPAALADPAFVQGFEGSFGRLPGPYAAYGYEAMSLALAAIDEAEGDAEGFRGRVVDAAFDQDRAGSVLGGYSIGDEGDTTLCAVQRYERLIPLSSAPCAGD